VLSCAVERMQLLLVGQQVMTLYRTGTGTQLQYNHGNFSVVSPVQRYSALCNFIQCRLVLISAVWVAWRSSALPALTIVIQRNSAKFSVVQRCVAFSNIVHFSVVQR